MPHLLPAVLQRDLMALHSLVTALQSMFQNFASFRCKTIDLSARSDILTYCTSFVQQQAMCNLQSTSWLSGNMEQLMLLVCAICL